MSAIKTKHESKTILDLSNSSRLSKHQAYSLLRRTEFHERIGPAFADYSIRVGMYIIHLHLINMNHEKPAKYLKDYSNFYVTINEIGVRGEHKSINLKRDARFNGQDWITVNNSFSLRTHHLADIIIHCQRLDALKAFL